MLFNCFLIGNSMTMKGGNTQEVWEWMTEVKRQEVVKSLIRGENLGRSIKSTSRCSELTWKYDRCHHYVDYYRYKQKPILKSGVNIPKGNNEYGLVLKEFPKQLEKEVQYG